MSNQTNKRSSPIIGDVYMINFGDAKSGSVQSGWRPGIVFQNNTGNMYSPNIIALPLTTSRKKVNQPTHVLIEAASSGLAKDSMVLCENPECISKSQLGNYLTTLSNEHMKEITSAYLLATSCISFLDIEALLTTWQEAGKLNAIAI